MSPTARSLDYCRRLGWTAGVVERWNPHAHIRQDLFGFADLVVLDGGPGPLAVQATTRDHGANRVDKIEAEPRVKDWLRALGRVEVWTWAKAGKAGAQKRWLLVRTAYRVEADGTYGWEAVDTLPAPPRARKARTA